ncbi:MAG: tetratricopeptide repeat protein [Rhodospirillales bacterium]
MLHRRAISATILSGRVEEGIRLSEELLKLEPDNALAAFAVAVGRLRDGRLTQSEALLDNIPTSTLPGVAAQLMRAWILSVKHDTAGASEVLSSLQTIPAVADIASLHKAWMKDAAGSPVEAADILQTVLADQRDVWYRLAELAGNVYNRAGRPDAAADILQRYRATHGFDAPILPSVMPQAGKASSKSLVTGIRDGAAEALFDVASLSSRQNQREQALAFGLLGLYLKPDFPALKLVVAELIESVDRLADANKMYQAIDRTSPLSWVARLAAARNLDALERFDESEALLRAMAKESPRAPEPLIQLGDEFRRLERFAEAVQVYDQAAARIGSLDQRHWRLLYARGIALERTKAWDRAEADFLRALELEGDQPFVLNYLGYSWVEQGKNLDRAQEMITRAVELRPNDGYIVDSLGWVLYRLGRYEGAVETLERAVELKPEDPVINDHLGDAYWNVGRQREARFQWRASLARDPEPELRTSIEKKLSEGLVREASVIQP